jgi:hypothetical protein
VSGYHISGGTASISAALVTRFHHADLEGLRNFRDHFSPTRESFHNVQTDLRLSLDTWLLVGGGVMMIFGSLALLSS